MTDAFDVVIVGGGAAGCVVAARVAELGDASVLLLEAGPDLRADVPAELRDGWSIDRRLHDWGYTSEPGWFGEGRKVRRLKALGGTSFMTRFAMRGSPLDFERWVELGNTGWGWDDVLPSFRRLETDAEHGGEPWHGDSGPMPISRYPGVPPTDVHAAAIDAAVASGFEAVEDHNRPGAVGVGRMPMNTVDGVRVTTASAYLPLGRIPPNLEIRGGSEVATVAIDGSRVRGVRLVDGTTIEAGTVVLAAGVYGSPSILLRSGLGPADELGALRIPVRADLPGVGRNLADHPTTFVDAGYRGPYRETPLVHTAATFRSSVAGATDPPDLMLWITDPDPPSGEDSQWGIEIVLLTPRCRGRVSLRSPDPAVPPRIELPDPHDPADLDRLLEGYGRAAEVLGQPALRARGVTPPADAGDRAAAIAAIEAGWYSVPHTVGTCAMGPSAADGAVVDARGRVHGLEGLYVVDASIIPAAPSGFTHLPTIMLAERLSGEIVARLT